MAGVLKQAPLVCPGHNRGVVGLQFSPVVEEGLFLVSACLDSKPMLRDGASGDWIGTFEGHKGAVWGACISEDALLVATGSADFSARLWDAVSGDVLREYGQRHICKAVAFSRDKSKLVTAGAMSEINVFDVEASDGGSPLNVVPCGSGGMKFVGYLGDTTDQVVTGGAESGVSLWDLRQSSAVAALSLEAPGGPVKSGELSRAGTLLSVVRGETAQFWDLESLKLIQSCPVPRLTESVSLHPEGKKFVAGGQDLTVRVFDLESGAELDCNRGHHGPVWVVRFSPDGESYASGSDDSTVRIWPFGKQEATMKMAGISAGA